MREHLTITIQFNRKASETTVYLNTQNYELNVAGVLYPAEVSIINSVIDAIKQSNKFHPGETDDSHSRR